MGLVDACVQYAELPHGHTKQCDNSYRLDSVRA